MGDTCWGQWLAVVIEDKCMDEKAPTTQDELNLNC